MACLAQAIKMGESATYSSLSLEQSPLNDWSIKINPADLVS
jgi:hypothetical protein